MLFDKCTEFSCLVIISDSYICVHIYTCDNDTNPEMRTIQNKLHTYTTEFDYVYILIFLVQVFLILVAGSYINVFMFCIVWVMYILKLHSHSILITVLVALSTTFQLYNLSSNTKTSLFATPERDDACYMSGFYDIESIGTMNQKCNRIKYKPFVNRGVYELKQDPDMMILSSDSKFTTQYEATKCSNLGVSCFMWKVGIPEVSGRLFEPCWDLVDEIEMDNVASVLIMQTQQTNSVHKYEQYKISEESYILAHVSSDHAIYSHLTNNMTIKPMTTTIPDMYTRFVVVPIDVNVTTSIKITISVSCQLHKIKQKMQQTGVIFLSVIAGAAPFTLYYVFSGCEVSCQHNTPRIVCIYICNLVFSVISLYITHDCRHKRQFTKIVIFFWLTTSIIVFNWIIVACICWKFFNPDNARRLQLSIRVIHALQFVMIAYEFFNNRFGQNIAFILSSQQSPNIINYIFMSFKMWDYRIYYENCILFLVTNLYGAHILYSKNS